MRWYGVAATAMRDEFEAAAMLMGGDPTAGLAVYHGDTDSRGGRAAHVWLIALDALYILEFTPGGNEPTTGPGGDEPPWTVSGERVDWVAAPALRVAYSNTSSAGQRRVRVTYSIGDNQLTTEEISDLAEFAREYWLHHARGATQLPTE